MNEIIPNKIHRWFVQNPTHYALFFNKKTFIQLKEVNLKFDALNSDKCVAILGILRRNLSQLICNLGISICNLSTSSLFSSNSPYYLSKFTADLGKSLSRLLLTKTFAQFRMNFPRLAQPSLFTPK